MKMIKECDVNHEEQEALRIAILDRLGASLAGKRKDSINARAASGIEKIWEEDEEYYQGYDDANRHEFVGTQVTKPNEQGGNRDIKRDPTKSTVFPNITSHYVDTAAAKVSDTLLPTDDTNFLFEPTPIPDLIGGLKKEEIQPGQMMQLNGAQVPVAAVADELEKIKAEAAKRCEKAQNKVDDWLAECQYHAKGRKVIHDCAKLGTGVMKGPVPVKRHRKTWVKDENGNTVLHIIDEIKPASFSVSPLDLFPDESCGENIHDGSYIFERSYQTSRQLSDLKGTANHIDDQIEKCLEEGPGVYSDGARADSTAINRPFEMWHFYGIIKREEMEAAGVEFDDDNNEPVHAMIVMVNDRVIRASINPIESGDFPYDVMRWKRRAGHWAGVGVARQVRTAQRIVVAGTRNLMQNAGASARPNRIINDAIRQSKNDPYTWEVQAGADVNDIRTAMMFFNVPSMQVELMNIIKFGMDLAERETGLPMLLQGQQGAAPDTARGTEILNNNANSMLRNVALIFDDDWTVPHMTRYYDWLMTYSEDAEEKPDATIVARGSTALVEKTIQTQSMMTIVQMCLNPAFEKSPKRAMDEFLKALRFRPDRFEYTDDEKAKMAQQQPMPPPQIAVAQIRAQADTAKSAAMIQKDLQIAQMENQTDQIRIKVDTDRDVAFVNAQHEKNMAEAQARLQELVLKRELAMLQYASDQKITLDKAKADLAGKAMTLRTQKELAAASNMAAQVATPAFEPPGRAPEGQAFQL